MLQKPGEKYDAKTRVRYPGIVSDAKALGITRITLWRYLTGRWAWPHMTRIRYDLLKREQAKAQAGEGKS